MIKPSFTPNRGRAGRGDVDSLRVVVAPEPGAAVLAEWDRLVDSVPDTDVAQLSSWARFRAGYGYRPLYVLVFDVDTMLGGAQILCRRIPVIGDIGYVPHGPVVAGPADSRAEVVDAISHALARLARRRFRMLFVQPPLGADEISHRLATLGFRKSTADLAPAGSVRIDLDHDEEQLRRQVSRTRRKMMGKWDQLGVKVRIGGADDLPLLARMLADTAEHQGFRALTEPYLQGLHAALSERTMLFVGEVHGRPAAAGLVTVCGATVRGRLKGMDRSEDVRRLHVPAAVEWELIKWAKENGYRWFDLGGVGEPVLRTLVDGVPGEESTWDSADRFKLLFGGTAYRYPTPVELIRPRPLRFAYDLSQRFPGGRNLIRRAAERLRGGRSTGNKT